MIDHYKVVCNTAAGRRRYMQYLVPFVVACDIVDRYDIWVNTINKQDIAFFRLLAKSFPKINLVWQPDGIVNGNASINAFYKQCIEEDTIYFKLDDDIVWMEPGLIEKMMRFRINNPEYFLVSPLVINNALCTYILQNAGKIQLNRYYPAYALDDILWKSGEFALQLHNWFLNTQLPEQQYKNLHCGARPVAMNRFSINAILWFGQEMKKFDGIVPGDDEEWLSVVKPTELGLGNCFNGDAIVAHFAFYTQRENLDKGNILEQYGVYLQKEWQKDKKMNEINTIVQNAMSESERVAQMENYEIPYKTPTTTIKQTFRTSFLSKIKIPIIECYTLGQIKQKIRGKKILKYIV